MHPAAGAGAPIVHDAGAARPVRTLLLRPSAQPYDIVAGSAAAFLALHDTEVTAPGGTRSLKAGDLLYQLGPAALSLAASGALLVDAAAAAADDATGFLGRDELAGRGITGITGLRALRRTGSRVTLRLGPPPGARWVIVGLRALAVFTGKLTLIDAEEPRPVGAGQVALIEDPTATLYLQAGNDSALAIGFAGPQLVVALG